MIFLSNWVIFRFQPLIFRGVSYVFAFFALFSPSSFPAPFPQPFFEGMCSSKNTTLQKETFGMEIVDNIREKRLYNKPFGNTIEAIKVLLQYYSVLHNTTPVPLCTTKYYSSTTLYYKVLLQYYSVLQSTSLLYCKVLLRTTKYNSGTTKYQSTTPVLHCTTKYYSSTTLYYKVLLQQYYKVLQSTTPYYKVKL